MSQKADETWYPGIMNRWLCAQAGQLQKNDYGCRMPVRYRGTDEPGWLSISILRIHGARGRESIQQRVERVNSIESHANLEWLLDYSMEAVGPPYFPVRQQPGLCTVSMPVGTHTLGDYYNWHARLMLWKELIAFCHSIIPAVVALHREQIYHGNITAENIFFDARSSDLQRVAVEDCSLILGSPYLLCQTLASFPHTPAAFLMRTPEQIDEQRFGSPGPYMDIHQLATMLYRQLTGCWPFAICRAPSLQQIIYAICDEKKFTPRRLPRQLDSIFPRALGWCKDKPRIDSVEAFGREVVDAAQECQEEDEKARRGRLPASWYVSRRQVMRTAVAVVTAGTLVTGVTLAVKSLEDGARPLSPPSPPVGLFNALGNHLSALISLPGNEFITGNMNGLLTLYMLDRPGQVGSFQMSKAAVRALAISADRTFLVCCDEQGLVSQLGEKLQRQVKMARFSHDAHAMALLGSDLLISDGARVSIFASALEISWPSPMPATRQYQQHVSPVTGLATLSDDLIASSSMDRTVRIWHGVSLETVCTYTQHAREVLAVAATTGSEGVMLASADQGGSVDIWIPQGDGKRLASYQHRGAVHALAWSPSGRYLLSGGDDALLQIYDTQNMRIAEHFTPHHGAVVAVNWLSEQQILTMSAGEVQAWQVAV